MARSTIPGVMAFTGLEIAMPARTPGILGLNDQGGPRGCTRMGDTPGCTGVRDGADFSLPWPELALVPALAFPRAEDGTVLAMPISAPPLPAPSRPPWMAIAEAEARKYRGQDESIIEKTTNYATAVGTGQSTLVGNDHPWCAAFVNWCLQEAQVPIDNPTYPDHTYAKGRAHGFYEVRGPTRAGASDRRLPMVRNPLFMKLDDPVFGAIAMVTTVSGHGEHVGFVYSRPRGNTVVLLGGNQGSTICFAEQDINAGDRGKTHLLFFFPNGPRWSAQASPPLGSDSMDALNQNFGIATPKGRQARTTR